VQYAAVQRTAAAGILGRTWQDQPYPVIFAPVKTAISVPDDTFTQAEQRARMREITRSQFCTQAAQRYLEQLDAESLTSQIDVTIDMVGPDESNHLASTVGQRILRPADEDDW
jgi:hypothetical protein